MKKLDIYNCDDVFTSSNEIMELVAKKNSYKRGTYVDLPVKGYS